MNIAVINGTPQHGVTYLMKEEFLRPFRADCQITEFYPKDFPPFCTGCKTCFFHAESDCPHAAQTLPVWEAMMTADVIVFAYPVYVMRAPAAIKSLLDHLATRWMVHRPEPAMFKKTAVIITNSVGAPNGSAQKDAKTSLNWMGVSRVFTCGMGMMGDILVDRMTAAHRAAITRKMQRLAARVRRAKSPARMNLKVRALFSMAKVQHAMVLKGESEPGLDSQHYIAHGWISPKKG